MANNYLPDEAGQLLERAGTLEMLARRAVVPETRAQFQREAQLNRLKAQQIMRDAQKPTPQRTVQRQNVPIQRTQRIRGKRKGSVRSSIVRNERAVNRFATALYSNPNGQASRFTAKRLARSVLNENLDDLKTASNVNEREIVARHNQIRAKAIQESEAKNRTLSTNTRLMLERLRNIQTKGQRDNDRMQRVLRERRIIAQAGDLMKTPNLFKPDERNLNILREDPDHDILRAPNTFANNPDNNILRPRGLNILQTSLANNNIMERRPDSINILEARPELNILRPQDRSLLRDELSPFSQEASEAFRLRW